jgi:hypothetical protein
VLRYTNTLSQTFVVNHDTVRFPPTSPSEQTTNPPQQERQSLEVRLTPTPYPPNISLTQHNACRPP